MEDVGKAASRMSTIGMKLQELLPRIIMIENALNLIAPSDAGIESTFSLFRCVERQPEQEESSERNLAYH